MSAIPNSVRLSQELIRYPSLNPPGEEAACIAYLVDMLIAAGLEVETHDFAPGRPSIVARVVGESSEAPLCFTGHIDVVPLGAVPWQNSPYAGEIVDGKLFGRGASDMKAGVAAFVAATLAQLNKNRTFRRGITLVITAGEETGCQGAFHLGRIGALGSASLLIVAEPSSNQPIVAHKGSVRLSVQTRGKTAHSSMPEIGDNAVDKAAELICRLRDHKFNVEEHPLLGSTTSSVTTISGGQNINSVPDAAGFTIDFRTVPSHSHQKLVAEVQQLFGPEAEITVVTDFNGFSTDPHEPVIKPLLKILANRFGDIRVSGAPYFTDASALVPAFGGVPTVVLGPGEVEQCHQTDEFCFVHRIEEAAQIYETLIDAMCR